MDIDTKKFELYKFRATETAESFYNLRHYEWYILVQIFSAFAIIGTVFYSILDKYNNTWVRIGFMILIITVLTSGIFLLNRIQERMKYYRRLQNKYLTDLHDLAECEKENYDDEKGIKYKEIWARRPQKIILWLTALSLSFFILFS